MIARATSPSQPIINDLYNGLVALARYGEAHPPPGPDRRGWLQAMADFAEGAKEIHADHLTLTVVYEDDQGALTAQSTITDLPQTLPNCR